MSPAVTIHPADAVAAIRSGLVRPAFSVCIYHELKKRDLVCGLLIPRVANVALGR